MKRAWISLTLAALVWTGCDKSTDPVAEAVLEEDVATAVAGAISEDDGGATDQLGDVGSLSTSGGLSSEVALLNSAMSVGAGAGVTPTYVPADTATLYRVTRNRGNLFGTKVSVIDRLYWVKFIKANGVAQPAYISGGDTARSMRFMILYGRGYHRNLIRVHRLDSLAADWMVTNLNTSVVTVNGTYYRAGTDTIRTRRAERTHANTLSATFVNVTRPRVRLGGTADAISGQINGTYAAQITFTNGDLYRERSITKDFSVDLSGENATIDIGGRRFRSGWRQGETIEATN